MNIPRLLPVLLVTVLTAPVWAQSTGKPLNLKLPPGDLPAASSSAATPAHDAPGTYYGDTSGRMGNAGAAAESRPDCDDSTYNQPQLHGSVGMGMVGGNHVGGSYQTGAVNLSQRFGDCDHPGGGLSISVGADSGHFHGRGH